jgi:hypothetical protein
MRMKALEPTESCQGIIGTATHFRAAYSVTIQWPASLFDGQFPLVLQLPVSDIPHLAEGPNTPFRLDVPECRRSRQGSRPDPLVSRLRALEW